MHLPHWLDLYVHWLKTTNMNTLQTKCIAVLAHVASSPQAHLRLIEDTTTYDEPRNKLLDSVQPGSNHEEENNVEDDILYGLDVLPDLVGLLRREGSPVSVAREISKLVCRLSSRPNDMSLWFRFQNLQATAHHFYVDRACECLAVVKGCPHPYRESLAGALCFDLHRCPRLRD